MVQRRALERPGSGCQQPALDQQEPCRRCLAPLAPDFGRALRSLRANLSRQAE